MRNDRVLNISGAVLEEYQLENFLEKLASDHVLTKNSDKTTYPIPRLKENFEFITDVYELLNEHIKLKIPINPAGEWILDNYYTIEETVKAIEKELTIKKYTEFSGISGGRYNGFARSYVLASEIVAYTDSKLTSASLENLLRAYQRKKTLSMDEIWNIGMFLQIAIIENIRRICEKIYICQIQKYKVESIIERLVENKNKDELQFKNLVVYKEKVVAQADMKYPFIEYMSYKLKRYGKKAYPFLNILEEQVNKMGTNISEVIQKEHFDIATSKVSIGNSITSLKTLQRINFIDIFEKINEVDEILKKDPANVFDKMDYKTKIYYRNKIKELSKKTKISEIYIANKCLELAQKGTDKRKSHIGYYLIDDGYGELFELLTGKIVSKISKNEKMKLYILIKVCISVFITILSSIWLYYQTKNIAISVVSAIILYVPIEIIIVQIMQYILGKIVKPGLIPKLDFQEGIPDEYTSFVVIPTILNSKEKVRELMKKLEVYYLANESENIYFALLGDCTSSSRENESFDNEVQEEGIRCANELNTKYPKEGFKRFQFVYRKRVWNDGESSFLGWERKRGLLNQFNEYILSKVENPFRFSTIELEKEKNIKVPNIKYIITLDSDTELVLNTGIELIGAMAHILNEPILNENKTCVVNGHGIIQPRVGINLDAYRKTIFTKIYAGSAGTDSYTNAISDIYQDNFGEGIFTGKGIYDLKVFSEVLTNQIPENMVLSHDLLEGCYLRCGLATDIMLMDGYPTSYQSFKTRLHRWTRGDFQIIRWLKDKIKNNKGIVEKNPLNTISKYKILDNLVRSIFYPIALLGFIYFTLIDVFLKSKVWLPITILFIALLAPMIIELVNKIIYRKDGESAQKTFQKQIKGVKGSIIRGILEIACLPDKAYMYLDSIIRTIYRMCFSKRHLLEWTTAEDAEKKAKNTIISYYQNMLPNVILGILGFLVLGFYNQGLITIFLFLISALWIITPAIMFYISKKEEKKEPIKQITKDETEYILQVGKKTWQFFKDNLIEKGNYLPPDNYQEDRIPKVVYRTSPTNIGLGLLAVISSYDLKYENLQDTLNLLEKMLETISKLDKWNGHLYNWYNIENLKPLVPKYVSTVDSGNFVGYLYTLKQFLEEIKVDNVEKGTQKEDEIVDKIKMMIDTINNLIENTDFSKLYSKENKIFSIGYNVEENALTDSYYDLLASESRQASIVAIAKKDVSEKHWAKLARTLTTLNKYKGLVSWSGTAFEYLMPSVNIPQEEGSLLDESIKFAIMSQMEYAKLLKIPWGISEAAFSLRDLNNNYQYKAFGIPWLGIKRGLADDIVVSSYGGILAINIVPKEVIQNLKELEKYGMYQKYGFYESIDYTPNRMKKGKQYEVIKTYMAHHQGLILLSINNLINNQVLQKRFMENPEVKAVSILLQERMPENVIITKEKKEKVEKIKNVDYEAYCVREYNKVDSKLKPINVIANKDYTIVMDQKGRGYSKYKDILINRYKETDDEEQGIFFFLKNIKTKRIWTSGQVSYLSSGDKYNICFTPEKDQFTRIDGSIETICKVFVMPNEPVEIRDITLKNHGNNEEIIEITSALEPVLSTKEQDYAHKAFNNLFLSFEYLDEDSTILVKRNHRAKNEQDMYMGVNLYTKNETIGELEYEIDKEKFVGRGNIGLPKAVEMELPLSKKIGLTTDPFIALKRTVRIMPGASVKFHLIIGVSNDKEEAIRLVRENLNDEKIARSLDLAKAKVEAETMYLGVRAKEIEVYQKLIGYLIYENPLKNIMQKNKVVENASVTDLWKYGISGDLPILMVKIKEPADSYVIKEVLKAYEYMRVKNINVDLVILNEEKKTYDNYVAEEIQNAILDKNMAYLQNIKGGIFVLNHLERKERELLEYRSNIVLDASLGNIERQINDFEEEYIEKYKDVSFETDTPKFLEEEKVHENLNPDNFKYYNEYGGFSNDGKEYVIRINKENRLPSVWCNIMANDKFGTVVTENMGGYTWYKNSRLNRLTAWNNSPVTDVPSEVIYLKDKNSKKIWSLGLNPLPDDNDYNITYGFGYSKFSHTSQGIIQKLDVFVPREDSVKVQILELENIKPQKQELKIVYYVKPVLDEDEIKSNELLNLEYYEKNNLVTLKNTGKSEQTRMYVSCSEKMQSYTGDKNVFVGKGNLENPDGLHQIELNKENSVGKEAMIGIEINVNLEALERKKIVFVLGAEESLLECQEKAYRYTNINNALSEYEKEKRYWEDLLGRVQVNTPLESMNIMLNGWLIYQTLCSRMLARSGYYQSGGAFGFRDQLQDTIGMKYFSAEIMKKQIIKHSEHQFVEGDVQHWWHDENKRGIRTRFSDDLLWLPYLVTEYIEFTGNTDILDIETNYLQGESLQEGIDEKYDLFLKSDIKETIYEHCKRAINRSENFGENGIPKIGSGDWNDGFSSVGDKGKGESIWLGFFLYRVLDRFIKLAENRNDLEFAEKCKNMMSSLKKSLNSTGWDGRWYRRAFTDEGQILR